MINEDRQLPVFGHWMSKF